MVWQAGLCYLRLDYFIYNFSTLIVSGCAAVLWCCGWWQAPVLLPLKRVGVDGRCCLKVDPGPIYFIASWGWIWAPFIRPVRRLHWLVAPGPGTSSRWWCVGWTMPRGLPREPMVCEGLGTWSTWRRRVFRWRGARQGPLAITLHLPFSFPDSRT